MEETYQYLEGISKGRIERVIMRELKIGIDLLDGIEKLTRREKVSSP